MSNTIITPSVLSARALATLYNTIVLAGLVHRDYESDFAGKQGDTVTIRKPATFTVDEFTSAISVQNITEDSTTLVLDKHLDVSVGLTAKELTLSLDDFAERVLTPIVNAIAQDIDGRLAEELVDTAEGVGGGGTTSSGTSVASLPFRDARSILSRGKLPLTDRHAVLSPESTSKCLGDDLFVAADKSGSTDGLREASLGRVFGFDSYESQTFGYGSGDKGQADGVGFHRDAVALVTRTLEAPMGVAPNQVSVQNFEGLGLRVVKSYDITSKTDVVSVDLLIGVKELRTEGVVQLTWGLGS